MNASEEDELYRPTFFELIAQDQLRELIGPVLRYVSSAFAQSYPRYFLKLVNHHDEIFATMMFFTEKYYLENWSGSFAEHFYGLTRRPRRIANPVLLPGSSARSQAASERLGKRHVRLSLVFLVAVPYLRAKTAELYDSLGGTSASDLLDDEPSEPRQNWGSDETRMGRIRSFALRFFKLIYPYVTALHELSRLIFGLRYLFGKSAYWRASQACVGHEIRRISPQLQRQIQHRLNQQMTSPFARDSITGLGPPWRLAARRILTLVSHQFFESLKIILPGSIFMFKFLEWWYSPANTSRYRPSLSDSEGDQFPLIQPPAPLKPQTTGVLGDGTSLLKPILKGHCPLCRKKLANATAVPSGWVYCYKCIHL